MRGSHWIKLQFAKRRWAKKRGKELKEFAGRQNLYSELKELEQELQDDYNTQARMQPNIMASTQTPVAKLSETKGKLDMVKKLLYDE